MNEINITLDAFTKSKGLPETIQGLERVVELIELIKKSKDALNFKTSLGDVAKAVTQIERLTNEVEKLTLANQKRLASQEGAAERSAAKTEKENEKLRIQGGLLGGLKQQIADLNRQKLLAKTPEQIALVNRKLDEAKAKFRDFGALAVKSTNNFSTAIQSFQFKFNFLGNVLGGLSHSLIGGVASSFHEFFSGAIDEFRAAELNANRLAFAVKNVLGGSDELVKQLIEQSGKIQRESIFSDDSVQQAQTALLNYGLTGDQIQNLIPKIVDFASAQKIGLADATEITIKGISGVTKGLKTSGIQFEDTGSKTKNLGILMDKLGKFSGAAGDEMETSSGKEARFKNNMNDLQEGLGEFLTDVGIGVLDFFSDLGDGIGDVAVSLGIVKRSLADFNNSTATDEELTASIEGLKKKSAELQKIGIFVGDIGSQIQDKQEELFRRSVKSLGLDGLKDAIAEREKALNNIKGEDLRLPTQDEAKDLDPFQLTLQKELEILREYLKSSDKIKDDSTKEDKKTKKDLADDIARLDIKINQDSIERQKDALRFKAEQDKRYAGLTISNDVELANRRLQIDADLSEALAALEEKKLRDAAEIRIREITRTYADEKQKSTLIFAINKELSENIRTLKDKDAQEEVKRTQDQFDALEQFIDKGNQQVQEQYNKDLEKRKKRENDAFTEGQQLRLARARTQYQNLQAQLDNERESVHKQLTDLDNLYEAGLISQEEYERKREIITRESNKKQKDLQKQQNQEVLDQTKQFVDALLNAYNEQLQQRQENIKTQISDEERIIDEQRRLAEKGEANTLGFEKKRKAQLERQLIDEQKKQQRIKEVEAFFNAFAAYSKDDPKNAAFKAFRDVVLAKLIVSKFRKGGIVEDELNMYGGTMDQGILSGPSHEQGGILIEAEGQEGLFSKNEMKNFGKKNFYQLKALLRQPVQDDVFAQQAEGVVALLLPPVKHKEDGELLKEIRGMRQDLKNIPSLEVNWDSFGNVVTTIIHNGIKSVTTHKGRQL